ncbi:MAG: helix-turn-helix domain-containing protein [Fibrobacter sp.]|nr:helix-turn-helix domain-containing protein [Fibrobacter sp.]
MLKAPFSMLFSVSVIFFFSSTGFSDQSEQKVPVLQKLNLTSKKTEDSTILITSDSAVFLSPPFKKVFSGRDLKVEIEPQCKVDSLKLTVLYSGKITDTLGTFHAPPYCATWRYDTIPDQDQLHLQFGYVIFHPSGKKIICPPMPNRWVIDRDKRNSRKKYQIKQILNPGKIEIDGQLNEWENVSTIYIGSKGMLKMQWTNYHFFVGAHVFDTTISYADFLELHFDLDRERKSFSDINQRSIRFGPQTRSTTFAMDLSDSSFMPDDSINVLLNNEMKWRRNIVKDGYIIEASIPVTLLSEMGYLNPNFGFDVSIMDSDEKNGSKHYVSWSGSAIESNRYNPSQWGTAVLKQTMFPLKLILTISGMIILITGLILTIIISKHNLQAKKRESAQKKEYSELFKTILDAVQKRITDPSLSPQKIASILNIKPDTITDTFLKEMDCRFEHYIKFQKIQKAKEMLRSTEMSFEEIAEKAGFQSVKILNESFESITHTTPELFRERILEAAREAEEDEDE